MRLFLPALALGVSLAATESLSAIDYLPSTNSGVHPGFGSNSLGNAEDTAVSGIPDATPLPCGVCEETWDPTPWYRKPWFGGPKRSESILANSIGILGVDSYKGLGDTVIPPNPSAGYMNSVGLISGVNSGFGLGSSSIRGQIGGTMGIYDLKGRDTVNPTSAETQGFLTAGIYKRSEVCVGDRISWGLVYDHFWASQWGLLGNEMSLGQFRGVFGYALNANNEVGAWSTIHTNNDSLIQGGQNNVQVRASNQLNLYWKHRYDFGGTTNAYVGAVDPADVGSWQMGLLGQAPLNRNTSLYGNSTLAFPGSSSGPIGSNELLWNLSAGLMFTFGKSQSRTISGPESLPLQNVANNGNFLITD